MFPKRIRRPEFCTATEGGWRTLYVECFGDGLAFLLVMQAGVQVSDAGNSDLLQSGKAHGLNAKGQMSKERLDMPRQPTV